jgi:hypothetical protein
MTDRPIIFSAPMIRALLEFRKTQTRRLAWRIPNGDDAECFPSPWQKVKPGDRLWVRETWKPHSIYAGKKPREIPKSTVFFSADEAYAPSNTPWVPPIHMPRWASRLTLVVTAAKVEQLQTITDTDAVAEGVTAKSYFRFPPQSIWCVPGVLDHRKGVGELTRANPRMMYAALWDTLHGGGHWLGNPEVVALTFTVHKTNIDQMRQAA